MTHSKTIMSYFHSAPSKIMEQVQLQFNIGQPIGAFTGSYF